MRYYHNLADVTKELEDRYATMYLCRAILILITVANTIGFILEWLSISNILTEFSLICVIVSVLFIPMFPLWVLGALGVDIDNHPNNSISISKLKKLKRDFEMQSNL